MEFALIGQLGKSPSEIEKAIKKLGGRVSSVIHSKLAAVISNRNEVKLMRSQMKEAKKANIQVVSVFFLEAVKTTDPILYIISESLSDWGGDVSEKKYIYSVNFLLIPCELLQPYARIEQSEVVSRREAEFYTKSLPEKMTYKWKGKAIRSIEYLAIEIIKHLFAL